MKKYTKPEFYVTEFAPNEYVSACGTITTPNGETKPVKNAAVTLDKGYDNQGNEIHDIWFGSVEYEDGTKDVSAGGFLGDGCKTSNSRLGISLPYRYNHYHKSLIKYNLFNKCVL